MSKLALLLSGVLLTQQADAQQRGIINNSQSLHVKIQGGLIPYYAWCNRGQSEMTVWLPIFGR